MTTLRRNDEYPLTPRRPDARVPRRLSGVLAGGLVALAIAVCLGQWLAAASGRPGPGMAAVAGHVVAALAAVGLQLVADRAQDRRAALAAWAMPIVVVTVLWFGWWS